MIDTGLQYQLLQRLRQENHKTSPVGQGQGQSRQFSETLTITTRLKVMGMRAAGRDDLVANALF